MSFRTFVSARLSSYLLDPRRVERSRRASERARRRAGMRHRIELFHQVDDPYSHLVARALLELVERYDVDISCWLVPPPPDWAAPERRRLEAYSLLDAGRLARRLGLRFEALEPPARDRIVAVQRAVAAKMQGGGPAGDLAVLRLAAELGEDLWRGAAIDDGGGDSSHAEEALRAGAARREKLGHYLGGACYFAGEWTWGVDRLSYLEEHLTRVGARRAPSDEDDRNGSSTGFLFPPPTLLAEPIDPGAQGHAPLPPLEFFLSFRSPYTHVATQRVLELARAFGVEVRWRFVLPMVMRGLPVPRAKRLYILRDAAREARRHGVPFGPVADPVGRAVERGYSLLPWAIEAGRGAELCQSFLTSVWSQAVDAASDQGLRRIVEGAGLSWREAREHLDDPGWRPIAEENRRALLDLGLWGVPSFRVGDVVAWGQDRLWVLEDEYRRLLATA